MCACFYFVIWSNRVKFLLYLIQHPLIVSRLLQFILDLVEARLCLKQLAYPLDLIIVLLLQIHLHRQQVIPLRALIDLLHGLEYPHREVLIFFADCFVEYLYAKVFSEQVLRPLDIIHEREVGRARESTHLIWAILQGRIVVLVRMKHFLVLLILLGQQVLIKEVLMGQAKKIEVI